LVKDGGARLLCNDVGLPSNVKPNLYSKSCGKSLANSIDIASAPIV